MFLLFVAFEGPFFFWCHPVFSTFCAAAKKKIPPMTFRLKKNRLGKEDVSCRWMTWITWDRTGCESYRVIHLLLLPGAHHSMISSRERKLPSCLKTSLKWLRTFSVPSRQNSGLRLNLTSPRCFWFWCAFGSALNWLVEILMGHFWVSGGAQQCFSVVSTKSPALQVGLCWVFLGRAPYVRESCKNISGIREEAEVHSWNYHGLEFQGSEGKSFFHLSFPLLTLCVLHQ